MKRVFTVCTNYFCQPELELEKFDIFAELKKIEFPKLKLDLLK